MPRYLSPEWLAELDRACRGNRPTARPGPGGHLAEQLVVQQLVSDGPQGPVAYHLDIDQETVMVRAGMAPEPTVTFSQDYETAAAVAKGELSAQGAFMAGRVQVRGDLVRLVELHGSVTGLTETIGAATRALRDRTEF